MELAPRQVIDFAALAGLPQRRDFAFSATLGRAAWLHHDALEWVDDEAPGQVRRVEVGLPLPEGTLVELVDRCRVGLCRPIDAGVELISIDLDGGDLHKIAALATPRTSLLPRRPGEDTQLLAVTGFDSTAALLRIDWVEGTWSETGRLPQRVEGGVWLGPDRLALNLSDATTGGASVYAADLAAGRFHLLFEAAPGSKDRVVLYDPPTGHLVVTTDAPGYPAVGIGRLDAGPAGAADGVRFLAPFTEGDEAGHPCGFYGPSSARRLLLRHEVGPFVRLRTADLDTLEVSGPLPVPDGELGSWVTTTGSTLRFAFSAPDLPWSPARLDVESGRFSLDLEPAAGAGLAELTPGRAATFPGPSGPMPALVIGPSDGTGLVVVALHGGPIARWGSECRGEFQLFTRSGAGVVALDYPGSTGWGRAHTHHLFGRAGSADVEAVAAVVDALGADRVVLYGESYGAFLALAVAARREVAGVVAFAPFASFAGLKQRGSPEVRDLLELLERGNSDESGRNVVKGCRTIRSRVLIAHGTEDMTIPIEESRTLVRALREAKNAGDDDVRLVELEDQGHDLVDRRVLERWYGELVNFVDGLPKGRDHLPNETTSSRGAEQADSSITTRKEVDRMFELTKAEVLGLQALPVADSVVTDEVAGLARKGSRRRGGTGSGAGAGGESICLITLNGVLNNLNVLNIFGGLGGFGL